jgi:beta-phosphoglucomutase
VRQFSAAVFDLDGVLADTAVLHSKAWSQLIGEIGLEMPADADASLRGLERLASLEVLLGDHSSHFSVHEKQKLADRKNGYYLDLIGGLGQQDLLPGAIETLKLFKEKEIPIALASASKNAAQVINALQVSQYFDFVVDASTISRSKPAPEIFLAAASGLGANPSDIIGFEDAPAGIAALTAAGIYAVGIGYEVELDAADIVFSSLSDFLIFDAFATANRKILISV